jgi:hypothetical protein
MAVKYNDIFRSKAIQIEPNGNFYTIHSGNQLRNRVLFPEPGSAFGQLAGVLLQQSSSSCRSPSTLMSKDTFPPFVVLTAMSTAVNVASSVTSLAEAVL